MTAFDSTLSSTERPPSPDARGRGFALALLVHAALIVALAFGVHWRSSEPAGVEAELWSALPQTAARQVEPVAPLKVEPAPLPKVEPPPPPKVVEPPQPTEAEIALEKQRKEQQERERREREEALQREEALRREQAEAEKKRLQQEKLAAEQRERREAEALAQRLAKQREQNLEKMMAQAGNAAQSAGPSSSYPGRIVARVKPNIVFGDEIVGNPVAVVEVNAAADGTITSRRLVKSSGVKAWDDAVLRAIDRTETLPRDVDGRVPSPITIDFRPKG